MARLEIQLTLPNQLTLLRILLTPVFVLLLMSGSPLHLQLSLVVFVVAALTDCTTGGLHGRWGSAHGGENSSIRSPTRPLLLRSPRIRGTEPCRRVDGLDRCRAGFSLSRDSGATPSTWTGRLSQRGEPQAKTLGQFVVIYYILILYVGRSIPAIYDEFGPTIETLMHPKVLFGMMLLVTLSTAGTGIAYLFDNRKVLRELYERNRPAT